MGLAWDIAYAAGGLVTSPVWAYRLWRTGKWRTDWPGRFGRCPVPTVPEAGPGGAAAASGPTLLIHAVSVGEVGAIAPLVRRLDERTGGAWRVVVSTTTDTGTERARSLFGDAHAVVRYPFDLSACVNRFLDAVRPDVVALTELEVWPNFVRACRERGVRVCVINGRLSARSFRRYQRVRRLVRGAFASLDAAGVQTQEYAERFAALGTPRERISVLDSLKWDTIEVGERAPAVEDVPGAAELAGAMGIDRGRPLVVAGSTGPGEESLLIAGRPQGVQLLIAPRKPERFDEVAALSPGIVRRSRHPDGSTTPAGGGDVYLLDTIGDLGKAYALADVAVVGRSFLGLYGSNVLEPVAQGKPTVIGPRYQDFQEIVEALRQGGGIEVAPEPWPAVRRLLQDRVRAEQLARHGRAVMLQRRGVVDRYADFLTDLMPAAAAVASP